jgi:23S rRNA pseudouridine2605 synthase
LTIFRQLKILTKMKNYQKIRLSRYLAECGVCSRRKCGDLIKEGRIKINESLTKDPSFRVSRCDKVKFDGKEVRPQEKVVIALNKPEGYLSTVKDNFTRKTVLSLVDNNKLRLYPAGRLDKDSRGLIILTNDGDIAYRITHPKFNITKTYELKLDKNISYTDLLRIRKGLIIDDKLFKPDMLKLNSEFKASNFLIIRIHEGRKRIIRKAFKKQGYNVVDLKRIKIGRLDIGNIKEGSYRVLKNNEIQKIFKTL